MDFCLLLAFVVFHAGSFFILSHSLSAVFAARMFMDLLIGTRVCVPNYNDAMDEILVVQRDLHANDFARGNKYTFGIRTLLFVFSFVRDSRPSPNAGSLARLLFDTVTFCVGLLTMEMRTSVTHSSTGISSL